MRDTIFDKFIKERVSDHSSPVPADMWQRIVQEKEKDRKGAWWSKQLFLVAGVLLISIIAGTFIWNNYRSSETKFSEQKNNSVKELQTKTKHSTNLTDPKTLNVLPLSSIGKNESDIETNDKAAKVYLEDNSTNNNASFEENTNNSSNLKSLFRLQNKLKAGSIKRKITTETEPIIRPLISDWDEDIYMSKANLRLEINSMHRSYGLAGLKTSPKALTNLGISTIDCPKSGDAQNGDWFIEVFGSPDFVTKQNTLNKGTNTRLLQSKDSSESGQLSFTAGVRFSKELGENMVFKTGLQFTQINEKFIKRIENERRLTTVVTTRTIIGSQGQTILVRDTSVTEQIGYSQTTAYNRYRSIDIPLLLGYVFTLDGWQIGINGGPILNIKSWQEGEGLDVNLQPVSFAKNKATVYKKNTGFGLYGGLSVIKWVSARTSVFAEPYIRYNLTSLTNSSSIINEKYKLSGILLGVRYNLSNFKATH